MTFATGMRGLFFSLFISYLSIFPLLSNAAPLEDRDEPCRGARTQIYSEACWNTLGLSQWLDKWYNETPKCGDTDNAMGCCYPKSNPQEAWSTCFLRIMTQENGYDCSDFNARSCQIEVVQPKNDSAEVRYILRNMFQMYNVFGTWSQAVDGATNQAALVVPSIIAAVNPEKPTNLELSYVLTALTAGFAFFGAPSIAGAIPKLATSIGKPAASVGEAALVAVQQAPGVAKAIWPSGTIGSQILQIGNLQTQLAEFSKQASNLVNNGLHEAMYNHNSFIQMAGTGVFSGQKIPSLSAQRQGLDMAYRTYITSVAMKENKFRASYEDLPADGLGNWPKDRYRTFPTDEPVPEPDGYTELSCQDGCDHDIYTDWAGWVSNTTHRGWTADQCCHINRPTIAQLLSQVRDNNWADLGLLFDGSYRCTVAAQNSPNADRPPLRIDGDKLDFACISQLPQLMGCGGCPVEPTNGGTCQFVKWDGC